MYRVERTGDREHIQVYHDEDNQCKECYSKFKLEYSLKIPMHRKHMWFRYDVLQCEFSTNIGLAMDIHLKKFDVKKCLCE